MSQDVFLTSRPFLLMEGGPLFHLEERIGIAREQAPLKKKRALVAALITWLPLLVLSGVQGRAFGHSVPVSFVRDFSTYSRFLLAVPLLLLAENILGPRIAEAAAHFVDAGIVVEKDYGRFDNFVERGLRMRDSVVAEIVIAAFAVTFSAISFKMTAVHGTTWFATRSAAGTTLTWAGWWLVAFCMPLYQFLGYRWLWRLFLWFQFLKRVSTLNLQLFPTHPDGAAGLGFVGETERLFGTLLFSFSVGSAGVIANAVIYDKIPLQNFASAIGTYVVVSLIIVLSPLAVFTPMLWTIRHQGLHQYGALSTMYSSLFHKKWIQGQNTADDALLGTADIQSLADIGSSYDFVDKMKPMPIEPITVLHLVVASLLPLTPLLLTVMPLKEVMKLLVKFLV